MCDFVILVILDGWGISGNVQTNVIKRTKLPTIEKLNNFYPMTTLQASGISVGLPWGVPGNSEVGHLTLGSGKVIYQNLPRITLAIQDGSFLKNESLLSAMNNTKKNKSALHLMGLVGDGTVHSSMEHLYALIEMVKAQKIEKVFIHAFTDGRDSPPTSGVETIKKLQNKLKGYGAGKLATLCGRNWAMDRNNNWDRTEKAYSMLTKGKGEQIKNPINYLQESYSKNITDEYMNPAVIIDKDNRPLTTIQDGDSVIFFNFREDRARQLTKAFVMPDFKEFKRDKKLSVEFATMVEYEKGLPVSVIFPPEKVKNCLGKILSQNKIKQLRISETEKYAHVTYFFNGGKEDPFPGEDRILIPSPSVSKYDETPEMSASKITEKIIEEIKLKKYDFILVNYVNADMIGHTGNEKACIEAVKVLDKAMSILIPEVLKAKGCLLITADHGNIEELKNPYTGEISTEHSTNPVPLWFVTSDNHHKKSPSEVNAGESEVSGLISDIAPTILDIMKIKKPVEMTGESLLPILK
ncbi:2,3-bisphosphoglycerate-independent phosphoglycerate mutase [bacterium]|nr:2,3-bisphosphoglycerate-independent phosphoglycerate mutase [bacterium]